MINLSKIDNPVVFWKVRGSLVENRSIQGELLEFLKLGFICIFFTTYCSMNSERLGSKFLALKLPNKNFSYVC